MSRDIFHIPWRPIMWGAIGVAVFSGAMVALYRLDPRYAGYVAGGLLITCVVAYVVGFFLGGHDHHIDGEDARLRLPTDTERTRR
jgi:hypothetical protein